MRLGVLASGGGTNLQSIIDQCQSEQIDAEIVLVLSNNPDAGALARAEGAELPHRCINHRDFADRETFDQQVIAALQEAGVELVVLAGFMRIISKVFLVAFPHRIINIHPSLLPAFPGLHAQKKALEYGARFSGCTVHFVDDGVDSGPIILQAAVPILDDDTEDSLSGRILQQEHKIYPQAIQLIAENRVRIEDRRVKILDAENPRIR
ncbi:MAG: phosphoribosylglycinamide formyltransferase [Chloroflexi bacterium]|nr:phosphoribosylglycinamide formyltransferase [Chloroflexota bacterium]